MNKQLKIVATKSNELQTVIGKLQASGMTIECVGVDAFNVISDKTGAVMKRQVPASELREYARCMEYLAIQHGRDIHERFRYIRPVHN